MNIFDTTEIKVEIDGGVYAINKDIRNDCNYPHPPCCYIQRMNDLRTSKRYYSRPAGAFLALTTGAVQWVS